MSKNTKVRGLFWAFLTLLVTVVVGVNSYTTQASNLNGEKIFEGKTEDQIGLEFLEIYSYRYEEQPVISEIRDDYSFSVHRADLNEDDIYSNLYVVFKDLTIGDDDLPTLGLIDAMVYCSTESDDTASLIGFQRLGAVAGTNVYSHFIELPTEKIDACESNNFTFFIDTSRTEDLYGTDTLEQISLSDIYDVQSVSTGAQLDVETNLMDGFSGDLTKSSYNIFSWQKALLNSAIALVIVGPISFGLWYSTEKEVFNSTISRRKKK